MHGNHTNWTGRPDTQRLAVTHYTQETLSMDEFRGLLELAKRFSGFLAFAALIIQSFVFLVRYIFSPTVVLKLVDKVPIFESRQVFSLVQTCFMGGWLFGILLLFLAYRVSPSRNVRAEGQDSSSNVERKDPNKVLVENDASKTDGSQAISLGLTNEQRQYVTLGLVISGLFFSFIGVLFGAEAIVLGFLGTGSLGLAYGIKTHFI